MARKRLGYVQLEWTCPSCGTRNPGSTRTCAGCGAAMPDDVKFELPRQQELDTSEEAAARAAVGPDINCPYCGTRNRADAVKCSQCGGDLVGGDRRAVGGLVGAFDDRPAPDIPCPHCGAQNPAAARRCSQCGGALATEKNEQKQRKAPRTMPKRGRVFPLWAALIIFVVIVGTMIALTTVGTGETVAVVDRLAWHYSIQVQAQSPVAREGWRDQVPANAAIQDCVRRVRRTEQEPVPGAQEVCGTPYVVDTGTGQGRVVQDCVYQVSDDWCRYRVNEWRAVPDLVTSGEGTQPYWSTQRLAANEREVGRKETYIVVFMSDDKEHRMSMGDRQRWLGYEIGSEWIIETNALGGITSHRPVD